MRPAALVLPLALAACAAQPSIDPPTQLPEVRPGYVAGYLQPSELPDSLALLPPPPAAGSPALARDEANEKAARALQGTARWALATADAELRFPAAARVFACTLGIDISEQKTPHLNMLLRRVRMDASRANDRAKNKYHRLRPFMATHETPCSKDESSPNSYPSGHASIGWAWALTLAQIDPENATAILRRGLDFGASRIVCGVHWTSDVEAGRLVGAATVSRLHAKPVYVAQLERAREEIDAARANGSKPAADCDAEARALD